MPSYTDSYGWHCLNVTVEEFPSVLTKVALPQVEENVVVAVPETEPVMVLVMLPEVG